MYVLHNSQGQLTGFHDLMELLNFSRLSHSFRLLGSILFHTIGPKLLKDLSPLFTVSTFGLVNDVPDLVSLVVTLKISFMNGGDKSCLTLYISMATWRIFRNFINHHKVHPPKWLPEIHFPIFSWIS